MAQRVFVQPGRRLLVPVHPPEWQETTQPRHDLEEVHPASSGACGHNGQDHRIPLIQTLPGVKRPANGRGFEEYSSVDAAINRPDHDGRIHAGSPGRDQGS